MKRIALVIASLLFTHAAHADCPPTQAACLLHEEGTTLLQASRFDEAAAKFRASIATTPSARAQLGLALAVEGMGKLAVAYEAIVEAKRLSDQELAATPQDVEAQARAERIKYKLGELRTKIGLLRLELPANTPPELVVAVQRGNDGDLPQPLQAAFAVAPNHQPLTARLRDGRTIEFVATVAPGAETSLVIPIPTSRPPAQPPRVAVVVDALVMPAEVVDGGNAFGGMARIEVRLGARVSLTGRLGYLVHSDVDETHPIEMGLVVRQTADSDERVGLIGARAMVHGPFYAAVEAGVLRYHYDMQVFDSLGMELVRDAKTLTYAALTLGAGIRYQRIDGRIGVVLPTALDDVPANMRAFDLPIRFMASVGFEVFPF